MLISDLGSMALAFNLSRARGAEAWHSIRDTSSVSLSDDASMVTDHRTRLSSAHWQKDERERGSDVEEEKSTAKTASGPEFPPVSQSEAC